jgi:hypothetical protein
LNDGAKAADQFRRILLHRGAAPSSLLYPLAQLGAARAAMLTGDAAAAAAGSDAFFAVWKDADDTPPLTIARREFARLR